MRSGPNRYRREIDPFAGAFPNETAMADIEGRRHPKHAHDHQPETFDREPWSDDLSFVRSYRPYLHRVLRARKKR